MKQEQRRRRVGRASQ